MRRYAKASKNHLGGKRLHNMGQSLKKNLRAVFSIKLILIAYILGGSFAILLSLFFNYNKEMMGVVFFGGALSAILLFNRPFQYESIKMSFPTNPTLPRIMFFVAIAAGLVLSHNHGQIDYVPIEFFLCATLAGFAIVYQLLFSPLERERHVYIILLQIILLGAAISIMFLQVTPGPYGNDAPYHIDFIKSIIHSGGLNNFTAQYENFASFHILFAEIFLILNLNIQMTTLIISIVQILFAFIVFLICNRLFGTRAALGSAFLFIIAPHLIFSRYAFFPNTYSLIFVILFLLVYLHPKIIGIKKKIILGVIAVATLLAHPLTPIMMVAFIGMHYIIVWSGSEKKVRIPWRLILIGTAVMIVWLMMPITGQSPILVQIFQAIEYALRSFDPTSAESVTRAPSVNRIDMALHDMGLTMILLITAIGAFGAVKCKSVSREQSSVYLAKTVLLFLPLPFIIAIISSQGFPDRWLTFVELIATLVGGVGIVIFQPWLAKTRVRRLIMPTLAMVIIFMALTTPAVNPNAQIYSINIAERQGVTESETIAGEFVKLNDFSGMHGNSLYLPHIDRSLRSSSNHIRPWDEGTYKSTPFIVREYDMEKGFTIPHFGFGKVLEVYPPTSEMRQYMYETSLVYANNDVRIFNAN